MKDAVGSSLLLYLVIIILGVVGSIIIGTNAYSKAYKDKNNIISTINQFYEVEDKDCFKSSTCIDAVNKVIKENGYSLKIDNPCQSKSIVNHYKKSDETINAYLEYPKDGFNGYCIYKIVLNDSNDYYYSVVTFSHLNIPPFGTLFKTPVYGETRVYYNTSVEIEG